jgi:hypothetical protein
MLIDSFAKIITLPVRLSNATRSIEQYLLVKSQQSWKHFNACAVVYIRPIYDSFPSFVSFDVEVGVIHEATEIALRSPQRAFRSRHYPYLDRILTHQF